MNIQEGELIREYWSQRNSQRRRAVIHDYACLMRMSDGRAEDALDIWLHLLTKATPGTQRTC